MNATRYQRISDYGANGNLRTVVLVGVDGSIGWCCLPELDDGSVFAADGARLTFTDLMPLRGNIDGHDGSEARPEVHRILHCEGGELEVEVEWTPRLDYARATRTSTSESSSSTA